MRFGRRTDLTLRARCGTQGMEVGGLVVAVAEVKWLTERSRSCRT
jgi:hypothetical protein